MELTKSEMEIMDVLWSTDVPLSRSDLLRQNEPKTWKDSSIHILLNGLLQKGVIREAGFIKRSKTYGRTFEPTMSREEYYVANIFGHRTKPDMMGLFAALLARPEADEDTFERLQLLLSEKGII